MAKECFQTCIASFNSISLTNTEKSCLNNCVTRYLTSSERVSDRYIETTYGEN